MPYISSSTATRRRGSSDAIVIAGDPAEETRSTIGLALEYAGYHVRLVSTGDELLREARTGDVALIIAEVDLACAEGSCTIEALKRAPELHHIPVIAYSDLARVVSEARALSSGADQFLGDPSQLSAMFYIVGSLHASGQKPTGRSQILLDRGAHMASYATARNALVAALQKDAALHETGRFEEIGSRFDGIARDLPRGSAASLTRLRVALAFWDGWMGARDEGWLGGGNILKGEWPMLARRIASDLSSDRDISDTRVGSRFDARLQGV
jgi:CheY-like chemotaxis protein